MTEPIRLGLIGAGVFANKKHWPALSTLGERLAVTAVTSRVAEKAEALADLVAAAGQPRPKVYTDYRRMLAEARLDAVSVIAPPALNPEAIEAALQGGCHVIAEKPIAATIADGERICALPGQYGGRVVMIAENYRYMPGYRRAARLIAQGAIGRPQTAHWSVYAHIPEDSPYLRTEWRQAAALPGGFLVDGGVHHAAVFRILAGEVAEVAAFAQAWRADLPPLDTLSVAMRFASGATGAYTVGYATPGPFTGIEVGGSEGLVKAWRDRVELWRRDQPPAEWQDPNPLDGLVAMYQDFAEASTTGRRPVSTPEEALADLRLALAWLRAAETGRTVGVHLASDEKVRSNASAH